MGTVMASGNGQLAINTAAPFCCLPSSVVCMCCALLLVQLYAIGAQACLLKDRTSGAGVGGAAVWGKGVDVCGGLWGDRGPGGGPAGAAAGKSTASYRN